jgi:uncharacterized membrane protein
VNDDAEDRYARMADEATREAHDAAERAKTDAERIEEEMASGEAKDEALRQNGLVYGGLIGIAVVIIQPFLAATSLDTAAKISIIAFAVAVPLLAALILVNRQEMFRGRRTSSVMVVVAESIGLAAACVGVVAAFWHISWVAGVTILATGVVAMGVHSAGWWKVEAPRDPAS